MAEIQVLQGMLLPDGSLRLNEKPSLPPGPVEVSVTSLIPEKSVKEDAWTVLNRIVRERQALAMAGRTREEIDADLRSLRDELDAHAEGVERLQEEAQQSRKKPSC